MREASKAAARHRLRRETLPRARAGAGRGHRRFHGGRGARADGGAATRASPGPRSPPRADGVPRSSSAAASMTPPPAFAAEVKKRRRSSCECLSGSGSVARSRGGIPLKPERTNPRPKRAASPAATVATAATAPVPPRVGGTASCRGKPGPMSRRSRRALPAAATCHASRGGAILLAGRLCLVATRGASRGADTPPATAPARLARRPKKKQLGQTRCRLDEPKKEVEAQEAPPPPKARRRRRH